MCEGREFMRDEETLMADGGKDAGRKRTCDLQSTQDGNVEDRDFERRLQMAIARREAPLGLKQRVMAESQARRAMERQRQRGRGWMLQRIAASAVLVAGFGGFAAYRQFEEHKRGEETREKVMTALRITNRTLDRVGNRLALDEPQGGR